MTTEGSGQFVTGIGVIDVFAPIALGSVCRLQWRPATGATILVAELIKRFIQSGGRLVVCAGCMPSSERIQEWRGEMAEYELDKFIIDDWLDTDLARCNTLMKEAIDYTSELLLAGEDVLFVQFPGDSRDQWSDLALSEFSSLDASQQFVVLVITNYAQEVVEVDAGNCTTHIVLDPTRARAGLYPPVDPVLSTSSAALGGELHARRLQLVEKARAAFTAYRQEDPDLQSLAQGLKSQNESISNSRYMRLFACCRQPLFIATPYTGVKGIWRSITDSISVFESALQD